MTANIIRAWGVLRGYRETEVRRAVLVPDDRRRISKTVRSGMIADDQRLYPASALGRTCRPAPAAPPSGRGRRNPERPALPGLGKSRLSSNLNQLARAVNSGSLPVSPETEKAILEACAEIKTMSNNLTKALGVEPEKKSRNDEKGHHEK